VQLIQSGAINMNRKQILNQIMQTGTVAYTYTTLIQCELWLHVNSCKPAVISDSMGGLEGAQAPSVQKTIVKISGEIWSTEWHPRPPQVIHNTHAVPLLYIYHV